MARVLFGYLARWRISFHESGMGEFYPHGGRLSAGICKPVQTRRTTGYFLGVIPKELERLIGFHILTRAPQLPDRNAARS